uniref:Cytochrome b5 heme-binding domain-containing protein n=1 Tax=Panagrolaimus sp. JU765 TaxID=591449 RepID=A0AC34REL5_9BILA
MVDFASVLEISATDFVLLVVFVYVIYRLFFKKSPEPIPSSTVKMVAPMKKQDMTIQQLKKYNGIDDDHICFAILGDIYDVTRGRDFYGPGSAYENLAGHDATRSLATMDVKAVKEGYDDHSGLTADDLEEAKGWAETLKFKYPIVGRLLKPGEEPKDYGDEVAKL